MFIEYSEKYTQSNFGGLDFLQIKSLFCNKGDSIAFKQTKKYWSVYKPFIMNLFK